MIDIMSPWLFALSVVFLNSRDSAPHHLTERRVRAIFDQPNEFGERMHAAAALHRAIDLAHNLGEDFAECLNGKHVFNSFTHDPLSMPFAGIIIAFVADLREGCPQDTAFHSGSRPAAVCAREDHQSEAEIVAMVVVPCIIGASRQRPDRRRDQCSRIPCALCSGAIRIFSGRVVARYAVSNCSGCALP
jgi:hypothetical protein